MKRLLLCAGILAASSQAFGQYTEVDRSIVRGLAFTLDGDSSDFADCGTVSAKRLYDSSDGGQSVLNCGSLTTFTDDDASTLDQQNFTEVDVLGIATYESGDETSDTEVLPSVTNAAGAYVQTTSAFNGVDFDDTGNDTGNRQSGSGNYHVKHTNIKHPLRAILHMNCKKAASASRFATLLDVYNTSTGAR